MRHVFSLLCVAFVAACGSAKDETPDATVAVDSAVVIDANVAIDSAVSVDANVAVDGAAPIDASSDAAVPTDAALAIDAAVDAARDAGGGSPDASTSARTGQCYLNAHCGAGATCVALSPGGACSCEGTCNLGAEDACFFSTCTRTCSSSSECRDGMRCASSGTCALRTCSDDSACVAPYGCVSGFCRRRRCGDTECPSGTTCRTTSDGLLCVEDFLTFE